MKQKLKNILNLVLKRLNAHATPLTDLDEVKGLIKDLNPVVPDCGLMRFGPEGDGGYLIPDDLDGITACYSPGVLDISGFEMDCAERGMQVYLADKSVDNPAADHDSFDFIKNFIGVTNSNGFVTIDSWVKDSSPHDNSDLLLQMDIESYEYEVILSMSEDLMKRCRIMVIEFHVLEELFNKPFFRLARRAFDKILETHHCVHIHPNNYSGTVKHGDLEVPKLMELTFYRKDRAASTHPAIDFPHPLDHENTKNEPLVLPKCWYKG